MLDVESAPIHVVYSAGPDPVASGSTSSPATWMTPPFVALSPGLEKSSVTATSVNTLDDVRLDPAPETESELPSFAVIGPAAEMRAPPETLSDAESPE
jgi:hypothetical protein